MYSYSRLEYSDKSIDLISQKFSVLTRVEVLGTAQVDLAPGPQYISSSFSLLSSLLAENFFREPFNFYLKAIPLSQLSVNSTNTSQTALVLVDNSLATHDTVSFDSRTSRLNIQLTHQSFQRVPALQPTDYITTTKLIPTKRGHGSKQHVTFARSITVDLPMLRRPELALVMHIIKTIFNAVHISVAADNLPTEIENKLVGEYGLQPVPSNVQYKVLTVPQDALGLSIGALEADTTCAPEIYEYLNLVLLNSVQLNSSVGEYISSYEVPFALHTQAPTDLHKSTLVGGNFHANFLTRLGNWDLLSLHTESAHIMILRREKELFIWKCSQPDLQP